jgi:hypothetical protein
MDVVGTWLGKIYFAIAGLMLALLTFVAPANSVHDAPGKRRGIELELSRTFSFAIVRYLQSPDSTSAIFATLTLGRTKD